MPFETIAETLGQPIGTCRQLARRARRKLARTQPDTATATLVPEYRTVTAKFIDACSSGDFTMLLPNFPITVFDRTDDQAQRWPTWGIKLSAQPPTDAPDQPVRDAAELALACLQTVTNDDTNRYLYADAGINRRTIFIDTGTTAALDFHISGPAQDRLYASGRAAAATFLQRQVRTAPPKIA